MTNRIHALVPAAGTGQRFGADRPKQYLPFLQGMLIEHTILQLLELVNPQTLIVGLGREDSYWDKSLAGKSGQVVSVEGGKTRAETVFNMLSALDTPQPEDWVLVHDAVRPCIDAASLQPMLDILESTGVSGLSLGRPVHEAVKRVSDQGEVMQSENRTGLWLTQTPQIFRYPALLQSMQQCMQQGLSFDDEMMALHHYGYATEMLPGSAFNIKVTTPGDLELAEQYWQIMQESGGKAL